MSEYTDQKINLVINKLTKDQYNRASLSGLIQDDQLYMITDDRGTVSGDTRYQLVTLTPSLSTVSIEGVETQALTCQAEDLTINTLSTESNTYPIVVYMPNIPDNGARDFCVRVECYSSNVPSIAFLGLGENCDFESEDDSWATLETGVNFFNFTETKR